MNPQLIAEIVAKNSTDVEAIVSTIGISNLLKLLPHILNIFTTVQQSEHK